MLLTVELQFAIQPFMVYTCVCVCVADPAISSRLQAGQHLRISGTCAISNLTA